MPTLIERPDRTVCRVSFPIGELADGEIFPNASETHDSWSICADWDDPTAPRDGYPRKSQKHKKNENDASWIELNTGGLVHDADRALILQRDDWESVRIGATFQSLDETVGTTLDDAVAFISRVGIVAAQVTSRRYLLFCIEKREALCLYQRDDDRWTLIDRRDVAGLDAGPVTLVLDVSVGVLRATCAEAGYAFERAWSEPITGQAGFRATGGAKLYSLTCDGVLLSASGIRLSRAPAKERFRVMSTGVLRFGGERTVLASVVPPGHGKSFLLVWSPTEITGLDWNGDVRWRHEGVFLRQYVRLSGDQGRIYAMRAGAWGGEKVTVSGVKEKDAFPDRLEIIDSLTGRQIGGVMLPEDPDVEADIVTWPQADKAVWDIAAERGMGAHGGKIDFVLKRDFWDGWRTIWAYDGNQQLLWRRRTRLPYGHHYAVRIVDLDGDGELEVLAGGTAFRQDGTFWWEHDRGNDLIRTIGGGHYDAVWVTNDAATKQPAHVLLLSGSAGVFVLDRLTGKTVKHMHIGHAQAGVKARLYPRHEAEQCVVVTRWGNPGIITSFDPEGGRLWTIQPDFIGQGCTPVRVSGKKYDLLWTNTTGASQGLYDGTGEFVAHLPEAQVLWSGKSRRKVATLVLASGAHTGKDIMAVQTAGAVHLFKVEQVVAAG